MLTRKTGLLLLIALCWAGSAVAADADVCYTAPMTVTGKPGLTSSTVFKCPRAGNHTLPELANNGWGIVDVSVHMFASGPITQMQNRQVVWMAVIQKH